MSETPPPDQNGPDPETVAFLQRLNPLFEIDVIAPVPDIPPPAPGTEEV